MCKTTNVKFPTETPTFSVCSYTASLQHWSQRSTGTFISCRRRRKRGLVLMVRDDRKKGEGGKDWEKMFVEGEKGGNRASGSRHPLKLHDSTSPAINSVLIDCQMCGINMAAAGIRRDWLLFRIVVSATQYRATTSHVASVW